MGHSHERPTEPIRPTAWAATGATSAGGRPENQDAFDCFNVLRGTASALLVAVVADGVGGELAGDLASLAAVAAVRQHIEQAAAAAVSVPILLAAALVAANSAVIDEVWHKHGAADAASTMVLAAVADDILYIAHLGDSRAYLVRQGQAFQLTRDHSAVQEDIDAGRIAPTDVPAHRELHTITRFLGDLNGVQPDLEILQPPNAAAADSYSLRLEYPDRIILCTDGLTDVVSEHQIARIAGETQPDEVAHRLLQKAIGQGTRDNVTAVVIAHPVPRSPARVRTLPGFALAGAMALLLLVLVSAFAWSRSTPLRGVLPTETPSAASIGPALSQQSQGRLPQPTLIIVPSTDVPAVPTMTVLQPTVAATPTGTVTPTDTATPTPGIEEASSQTALGAIGAATPAVATATAPILSTPTLLPADQSSTSSLQSTAPLTSSAALSESALPAVGEVQPITAPPPVTVPLSSLFPLTETALLTGTVPLTEAAPLTDTVPLTETLPLTNTMPTLVPGQLQLEPAGQPITAGSQIEFVVAAGALAPPPAACYYETVLWARDGAVSPLSLAAKDPTGIYGLGAAAIEVGGKLRTSLSIADFMEKQSSFQKRVDYCFGLRLVCQVPVDWMGPEPVCTCDESSGSCNWFKVED